MTTVIAPHRLNKRNHIAEVKAQMETLGAPTLRAIWSEGIGAWLAIEGSHRLVAASDAGLTPVIQPLAWDDVIEHDLQDYESPCKVQSLESWILDDGRLNDSKAHFEFEDVARGEVPTGYKE